MMYFTQFIDYGYKLTQIYEGYSQKLRLSGYEGVDDIAYLISRAALKD